MGKSAYHVARPYVMAAGDPLDRAFNKYGYHGKAPARIKGPGKYRIFVLGGSTLVSGDPTIPYLLEEEFHRGGMKDVEVFNYGLTSANTIQDMLRVLFDVWEQKPDLIVFYGGGNDLMPCDPRPGYPHRFVFYENNPYWSKSVDDYPLVPLMLFGSHFLRYFYSGLFETLFFENKKMTYYGPTDELNEVIRVDLYLSALQKSAILASALGADFIAFFQPLVYFKTPLADTEKNGARSPESYFFMRNYLRDKIRSKGFKFTLVDISDTFTNYPGAIFRDKIHISTEGNKKITDVIYKELRQRVPSLKSQLAKRIRESQTLHVEQTHPFLDPAKTLQKRGVKSLPPRGT